MIKNIHIRKNMQGWYISPDTFGDLLTSRDKNMVVAAAVAFAKRWYQRTKVIIHGADGKILEERTI